MNTLHRASPFPTALTVAVLAAFGGCASALETPSSLQQSRNDAVIRLLPGVLGNAASTEEESFSEGLLEHPQYTRPAVWEGVPIPEVLTSGNHGAVERWRREQAEAVTRERRPDLWAAYRGEKG